MQLETLIEPRCSVPVYLQQDVSLVEYCGKLSGYVGAIVVTLITVFIAWLKYPKIPENATSEEQVQIKRNQRFVLGIAGGVILLVWITSPMFSGFAARRKWEGYDHEVKQLINQGYSRRDAINQVQSLYQAQQQAEAIRYAGDRIASSSRSQNSIGTQGFNISF